MCLEMMLSWFRAGKLRKLWDSLSELRSSLCERRLTRTVLRPALLPVKTAQFTQFFPSGMMSHSKISQFNWQCIAPITGSGEQIAWVSCGRRNSAHAWEVLQSTAILLQSHANSLLLAHGCKANLAATVTQIRNNVLLFRSNATFWRKCARITKKYFIF